MTARQKWQDAGVAEHYARDRFRSGRARGRDGRLIDSLWRRYGPREPVRTLLDLPCGTGRLAGGLRPKCERYLGADVSPAMLREGDGERLVADAARLPFADGSVDALVCCRLLHHLDACELDAVCGELLRVTGSLLIASFWDAASWPALRRRWGLRRETTGRRPLATSTLEACLRRHGGEVLGYAHSFPWLSMQTFVAVRPL